MLAHQWILSKWWNPLGSYQVFLRKEKAIMANLSEKEKTDILTFLETYLSIPADKRGVVDGFVQGMAYAGATIKK